MQWTGFSFGEIYIGVIVTICCSFWYFAGNWGKGVATAIGFTPYVYLLFWKMIGGGLLGWTDSVIYPVIPIYLSILLIIAWTIINWAAKKYGGRSQV